MWSKECFCRERSFHPFVPLFIQYTCINGPHGPCLVPHTRNTVNNKALLLPWARGRKVGADGRNRSLDTEENQWWGWHRVLGRRPPIPCSSLCRRTLQIENQVRPCAFFSLTTKGTSLPAVRGGAKMGTRPFVSSADRKRKVFLIVGLWIEFRSL